MTRDDMAVALVIAGACVSGALMGFLHVLVAACTG